MSWNKVAVVGAGLIKFGELFEQSYEQMAAGAFDAAAGQRRQGPRHAGRRRRHRGHPAGHAVGPGGHRRQHRAERHRPVRHPLHPGGERLPVGLRRLPHRRHGGGERRPRRGPRHRRGEDARQVHPGGSAGPGRGRPPPLQPGRDRPRALRPLRHPPHARVRDHARDAGVGGGEEPPQRLPRPLRPLPERDHRRAGAGLAPGVQPAAPARLLPPDRRRRRDHPHHGRAGPRVHRQARLRGRVRRGHRPPLPAREVDLRRPARHHGRPPSGPTTWPASARADIDMAEVHDCFTITEILDIEDLGLRGEGQGRPGLAGRARPPSTAASPSTPPGACWPRATPSAPPASPSSPSAGGSCARRPASARSPSARASPSSTTWAAGARACRS